MRIAIVVQTSINANEFDHHAAATDTVACGLDAVNTRLSTYQFHITSRAVNPRPSAKIIRERENETVWEKEN